MFILNNFILKRECEEKEEKTQKKLVALHLQSNMCEDLAATETGGKLLPPSAESKETRAQRLQQLL